LKTIFYEIPSSEIPDLLQQLGRSRYWRLGASELKLWDNGWQDSGQAIGSDPLESLLNMQVSGPIIFNGLCDKGIPSQLVHQIIDAHLQGLDQYWIIVQGVGEIPSDLAPFVQSKVWPMLSALEVSEILMEHQIYSDRLLRLSMGLYRNELKMLVDGERSERAIAEYKQRKLSAKGILHIPVPDVDAVGIDNILTKLDRVAMHLTPQAEAAGLKLEKGMILLGIPGTGKSLAAKTAAKKLGVPLICADWSGLISPEPGRSEANLNYLIRLAEAASPSILFFDDFDKAFASADLSAENGTEKRIAGLLLTWLQERTSKVFCIITCNRIAQLPPELKRRFEWKICVDLPHEGSRYEIMKIHLAHFCGTVPEWSDRDWKRVIMAYNECTPDEIAKAIAQAASNAFGRGESGVITVQDLLDERKLFVPANVADPMQISNIRLHSKHYEKAASEDNSVFRLEEIEDFKVVLGRK
jgi:hypothetical protein